LSRYCVGLDKAINHWRNLAWSRFEPRSPKWHTSTLSTTPRAHALSPHYFPYSFPAFFSAHFSALFSAFLGQLEASFQLHFSADRRRARTARTWRWARPAPSCRSRSRFYESVSDIIFGKKSNVFKLHFVITYIWYGFQIA
jgi:hypothetical protein